MSSIHYQLLKLRTAACALLICAVTHAQVSTAKLEEQFNSYHKKVLQEKMYAHVDRNFYLAGDILWCKLYVVDAAQHQPLDISKVAYIELIDENHTPVLQSKIALQMGKGNGSLSIPISIASGNYIIRAYTNWMKNAGADYFFEKKLTIVNTQKNRDLPASPVTPAVVSSPDIRFFPEGGNLVRGLSSRIACKAQGSDGKGITFKGAIINERNDTITRFQSFKFGMGNFSFTPEQGHTYRAVVITGERTFVKELPEVYSDGYVMQLNDDKRIITVSVQTNLPDQSPVFLLTHTRQSLKAVQQARVENGRALFMIERSKLGDGISNFTVFTSAGKPVCERLYFIYPKKQLSIDLNGNRALFDTRSKIDLSVNAADETGKPVDADMSVAVYRLDELQDIEKSNIESFLWLSADLKGQIESPAYYFGKDTVETAIAMDNLMLTQGWRRFRWEDVLQDKTPVLNFPPEVSGHIVTGKVVSGLTGAPAANVETFLSAPGQNTNVLIYTSEADGKVKFDFKRMRGTQELIVQPNSYIDSTVRVDINSPFFESYSSTPFEPFRLSKKNEKFLLEQSIGVQVQNVYAGPNLKQFTRVVDTNAVFEKPDAVYFLDDFVRFTTLEEVLREYVTMLNVIKRKDNFNLQLIDNFVAPFDDFTAKQFFISPPLILIDGVPVSNIDKLLAFEPLKLRKLEVYNKRYFIGNSFFSGIMNWSTYKGDLANFELDPHSFVVDYEGLQLQREFYSPVYDTPEALASRLPDYRTLLYWSPNISTDAKGLRHVQFYSSDKKGDFIAVVQGLTQDGNCGSGVFRFEVK